MTYDYVLGLCATGVRAEAVEVSDKPHAFLDAILVVPAGAMNDLAL